MTYKSTRKFFPTAIFALGLSAISSAVPSLSSYAGVVFSDDNFWPNTNAIDSDFDPSGGFVAAAGGAEFVGLDRNGQERTSTFEGTGTAWAQYGKLKASASGHLTNSFYNPTNAANGIPNIYASFGQVTFKDTLKFVGTFILPTFKVRYTYFVEGSVTGSDAYGALSVAVGANHNSFFVDNQHGSTIANYYTTDLFELNPMLEHGLETTFLAGFQTDSKWRADGSEVMGSSNFGSTVTLTGIEMFDENNNPFTNFSIESQSGTSYPTSPVPEPASLVGVAAGAIAFLRRRRAS